MATTYRLTDTVSDLSGGADFDVDLTRTSGGGAPSPPAPNSLSVSVAAGADETSYAYTTANDPNNADWETGTITVEVDISSSDSDIKLRVRASRLNAAGAVQESSSFTAQQTMEQNKRYDFTIPSKDWSAGDVGDRLRIDYEFTNTSLHGNNSVILETGSTDTEHVTQITFFASPQKQIFVAGPGAQNITASTTRYNTVLSSRISSANHETTEATFQLIGTPGTLRNLRIDLDTAVTDGSVTFTIRKNQIDTGLEVVITADDTGSDLITNLAVVAGDQINMKIVSAASTNTVLPRWSLEFEGDDDKAFNISAGTSFQIQNGTGGNQYNGLMCHGAWVTTSADRLQVCPLACTIKDWYIKLDTAPGVGESWTFRILVNESSVSSSEIIISGTDTTGNVTGLAIGVSAGNTMEMQGVRSSSGVVSTRVQSGIAVQADVLGGSWVGGWSADPLTVIDTTEEYILFGSGSDIWLSNSSQHLQGIGGSYTLNNFRVRTSALPGGTGDHQYTFRIRKNDAAGSSVVTIIDSETTDFDITNTDTFAVGDTIGISHRYDLLGTGTPAAMSVTWAAVQTVNDAGGGITVIPASLSAVAAVVDPGVIPITPSVRTMVAAVVAPIVILGSMSVTPAVTTAVATTVNPTVVLGSVSVTPAVTTAVAAVVDPTVVLGSISLTPAVVTVVAAVVNPTVLAGAETQKQVFIAGPGQFALSAITRYNTVLSTINANTNWETTEATFQLIATPGTLRNLRIQLDVAVTSGTATFTIRKNASDTALKVVITSGTSGIDITNDITVVAGDQINLKFVGVGNNTIQAKFGLEFEGDNDKEFNMSAGTSSALVQTAATQFNTLIHHDAWNTDGGNRINVCPLDGTITDWYLELDVAPGGSESWTFRLVKNLTSEASSEIVISGAGLTGSVTGLSIDIAPGDEIQMQAIRSSGSVVVSAVQSGVAIKADIQGESWVGGNTDNILTTTDTVTEFNLFGSGDQSWRTEELSVLQYAAVAFTLKNFRVRTNAGPGGTADHKYTFRLRKDEADGNSVVTLIDAETDKVDSTNEDSYSAGTEIGISHRYDLTGSGTPSTMRVSWSAIQTVDEDGDIVITPAALTFVAATVDPTVVLGSMTVIPAALTAVAAVVDPTLAVVIPPAVLTAVAATVDPTVVLGSVSVTPAALTAVAATVDPTVVLGSLSITPAVTTFVAVVVDPTVIDGGLIVTPAVLTMVAAVVDPTIVLGSVSVTPAALTAVAATVNPTLVFGSTSVTPAALTAIATVVDPTVVVGGLIITPAVLTVVAAVVDPTVVLGSMTLTPAVVTAVAAVVDPTLDVTIPPTALTMVAAVVDPTVVLGSVSVAPVVLTAVAATISPTVVLGSVSITPTALTFVAATVDPTVVVGSLSITPAALTAVPSTVDPTIVLGSIAVTPSALTFIAAVVDPTATGGTPGPTVTPAVVTAVALVREPTVLHSGTIKVFIVREKISTAKYSNERIATAVHSNEQIETS